MTPDRLKEEDMADRDATNRPGGPPPERDIERAREREREVAEARAHSRTTGVSRGPGGPVIEHTGFRLSWGAIFAGLVVALVVQVVLSVLGLAIGLTIWDPGDPAAHLGRGAGIWAAVAALISLFAGGLVAGRLAGVLTPGDGALHGGILWGLSVILTLWLTMAGAGVILGGAFQLVGTAAGAGLGVVQDDPGIVIEAVVRGDREAAVQIITERTGLTRQEADRMVRDIEGMVGGVDVEEQDVRRTADQVTAGVAQASWWALLALLLSAGAAMAGAAITARQ
jgi:hypothetical protein